MKLSTITLMLIILSTAASAYSITNTHTRGTELAANDRVIAFVTYEATIDSDLNNDNDNADRVIQYYDIRANRVKNTGRDGRNPSVDGDIIAFEERARMIMFYDTQDRDAVSTGKRGINPSIYGNRIGFITKETDEGIDLNDDGDEQDNVVQFYDISTRNTTNTQALGNSVLMLEELLVFDTSESLADEDYNRDNDRNDNIIQYYSFDSDDVYNTKKQGTKPTGWKESPILITTDGNLSLLDIEDRTSTELEVFGTNPSMYNDLIAYEKNGMLYAYRISTEVEMALNISGKEPVIYGDTIAFINNENDVSLLIGEDDDNDDIPDFADNCPAKRNAGQDDTDKDGIGDSCETAGQNTTAQQNTTNETKIIVPIQYNITTTKPVENTTQQITAQATVPAPVAEVKPNITRRDLPEVTVLQREKKDNKNPAYWFLVAVAITMIGILFYVFVPGWIRKRRRSFGF